MNTTEIILMIMVLSLVSVLLMSSSKADQLSDIKDIAWQNHLEHEWVYKKFMCGQFMDTLSLKFYDKHYQFKLISGKWFNKTNGKCSALNYKRFKCRHYWMEVILNNGTIVPVDPTRGIIIPIDEYKEDYR